jgi:hypothetical protein
MVSPESMSKALPNSTRLALLAIAGLAASGTAMARLSYCCNDANGRLACGDIVPAACHNRAYRVMDEKGRLVREVEAPLTPEQRALREAEKKRKEEEEKRLAEEKRRNQALLAAYPSERDIDIARDRALAEFEKGSAEAQKRLDGARKTKKKLDGEKEFYQKRPMPAELKKQVEENENDLKTLQAAVDSRKEEGEALRAKFEDDKKRYMELRYGSKPRSADAVPPVAGAGSAGVGPAPAAAPTPSSGRSTRTIIIRETKN